MGVRLFARHGKSLELTDAGRYFIARGERILDELENLHDATRRIAAGIETELRVSLNNIVSQTPLLALLKESEARFPHTEIHLAIDVHDGVWDALQDNRADLAVGAPNQAQRGGGIACEEFGAGEWQRVFSGSAPGRAPFRLELAQRIAPFANSNSYYAATIDLTGRAPAPPASRPAPRRRASVATIRRRWCAPAPRWTRAGRCPGCQIV